MNELLKLVKWELRLANRHQIIMVSILIALSYVFVLYYFRDNPINELLILLIFSDPVMMGFTFIGAVVLFEKNANTLAALAVSPLKIWQYLWAKGIAYTLLAIFISIGMITAGYPEVPDYILLIIAVGATSIIFIFLGFTASIHVKTFNQYVLIVPLFMIPMCLPLLGLFNLYYHWAFYLIPTHATVILLKGSLGQTSAFDLLYGFVYLSIWIWGTFSLAQKTFSKYLSTHN